MWDCALRPKVLVSPMRVRGTVPASPSSRLVSDWTRPSRVTKASRSALFTVSQCKCWSHPTSFIPRGSIFTGLIKTQPGSTTKQLDAYSSHQRRPAGAVLGQLTAVECAGRSGTSRAPRGPRASRGHASSQVVYGLGGWDISDLFTDWL